MLTSVQTFVFNFNVLIFITWTDSIQPVKTLKNSKITNITKLAQVIFIPEQPRHMLILLDMFYEVKYINILTTTLPSLLY